MTRIEKEKKVVEQMIGIYCRHHHHSDTLCDDCKVICNYAIARLEHCPHGESKTACERCDIHCYKPAMREQIRQVMRYAGPRMLWYHPITALRHLLRR